MSVRRLVFVAGEGTPGVLRYEGVPIGVGQALPIERKRSPWNPQRDSERVIVGSHSGRADVLLEGEAVHPEHLRLYFRSDGRSPVDLLVIQPDSTRVNGLPVEPREWTQLVGGEELLIGPWKFRYEEGEE
jgi:hypothetical protein